MSGRTIVALATSAKLPDLTPDDRSLVDALASLGIAAGPRVWSAPEGWVYPPSLVVIRSCWDYHLHLDEFLAWITRLERHGVQVVNPPALLRWNSRKRYLIALQD